jgi:uncharacterized protein (TIGR00255 family)
LAINSMTGFARSEGQHGDVSWIWELKSVNGRNLDMRMRLPGGLDGLEGPLRAKATQRLSRGNLNVNLQLSRAVAQQEVRVNEAVLGQILDIVNDLEGTHGTQPARIDGILALRGVLEFVEATDSEEDRIEREAAVLASFDEALDALALSRRDEGRRLQVTLQELVDQIGRLTAMAAQAADARRDVMRQRLETQVQEILNRVPGLAEDRLAQELAILMVKADISEEIQRLAAHVEAAVDLIESEEAVGRRLDFLCQEFNREANTLCSKASDIDLTQIGLELKVVIDRLREQVQNAE